MNKHTRQEVKEIIKEIASVKEKINIISCLELETFEGTPEELKFSEISKLLDDSNRKLDESIELLKAVISYGVLQSPARVL